MQQRYFGATIMNSTIAPFNAEGDLGLRKLSVDDTECLGSWLPNSEQLLFWGGPYFHFPLTRAAVSSLVDLHNGRAPQRECWGVIDSRRTLVGSFQIAYNEISGQADLGRVILDPLRRGKGHAATLLKLAINQAFLRPSVHRLELRVFTNNPSAIAAYRRAGFKHEGVRRESARLGDTYFDTAIMGLLRHELDLR